MTYKPLEDYGIIVNLETMALVGREGAIDWGCFPHFESASLFTLIIDAENGGHFKVHPATSFEADHQYIERRFFKLGFKPLPAGRR